MNTKPLVSIIIPTFNRAHLIGETLDSVLAQTYINWECIVVDDGSNDGTSILMDAYCARDSRFQYHHRPKDRLSGGNAARNYGFELSKGDYIQWFDSDDILCNNAIEKKIHAIKSIGCDFALCGFETFGSDVTIKMNYNHLILENITEIFIQEKIIFNIPSFLYSRKIVQGIKFDENLSKLQDLDFVFRVLKNKNLRGINIPEILIKTRIHEQSITFISTKNKLKDIMSELYVWKNIYNYTLRNSTIISQTLAMQRCLNILRKIMIKKHIILFIRELYNIKNLRVNLRLKLIGLNVLYFLFNRGDYAYGLLLKKILQE